MSGGGATHAFDWFSIRSWAGSQDRAFEELCFQLRGAAPPGWVTVKTAAPDGGVEWYDKATDGRCHGHQVKFVHDVQRLLPLAGESVAAVGRNRGVRNVVRLTFWVPFDLPDPAHKVKGKPVRGARQRWNDEVAKWKRELPGVGDIDIDLLDGGHLLERLLEPGNEGRQWFFFEQRALGLEWLRERQRVAENIAHDRYTPQHHVALPIASVIDGCALSSTFRARLEACAQDLVDAMPGVPSLARVLPAGLNEAGRAPFNELYAQMSDGVAKATEGALELLSVVREVGPGWMPASAMAAAAAQVARLLSKAQEAGRQMQDVSNEAAHSATPEEKEAGSRGWSREDTSSIGGARRRAEKLRTFCLNDAAQAAEAGRWVLLGEAGQGKTHLLVDATRRALEQGRPSLTIFAEQLSAVDPLTQIAQQLGLGALPHEVLLQAMDAAGAASDARFTLFIDALNDSDAPGGWRVTLPVLAAEMERYEHVALVVSCRSSLARAVLPDDLKGRGFPVTEHPGFTGHEVEALEAYLREAPSALPRTPLLTPAFSNPLFVKLYSDTVLSMPEGRRHTATTTLHRSAVFDAFVDRRARQISGRLSLDPAERPVHQAVQELATFMAAKGREVVSHAEARTVVDSFAPGRTSWPDTMLGQLVAHGVLATDRYMHSSGTLEAGIGFAYQAFSDDRIVRAMLDQHSEDLELAKASGVLQAGSALRAWLADASGNLIDAATVLLPEVTGHELIDLLALGEETNEEGRPPSHAYTLYRSVVHTLGLRKGDHVTQRTVDLLNEAAAKWEMDQEVLEAVLTVATQPGHRLNADQLHRNLLSHSPADRDAWWGIDTYSMLNETSALHRLLRWAEQLPTPDRVRPLPAPATTWVRRPGAFMTATGSTQEPPEEVARLAALTLVWTFTSPNRFLRDRATKAVVQLLLGYPDVLVGLLDQFLDQDAALVDDPYLFERLVLAAYGVLARTDASRTQPELLARVARRILDSAYGNAAGAAHASRNALLCDAATRIVRIAHQTGRVSDEEEARTHHPHACPEVGEASNENTLDTRYPIRGEAGERLWASLRSSFSGLADFTNYEVRPAVDHFSDLPLTTPRPPQPDSAPLVHEAVALFRDSLPEAVRDVLASDESIRTLLKNSWRQRQVLNEGQQQLLAACTPAPTREQLLAAATVDKEWASRWVLDNAARRGWTPERFGAIDDIYGQGRGGREGHKAERFGKKYSWLGLHELVERLANHRHMKHGPTRQFTYYPGAAALYLTDIDPTLPPAPHPLSEPVDAVPAPDADTRHDTFRPTVLDNQWNPPAPSLPERDRLEEWIEGTEELPDLAQLGSRTLGGAVWVVLNEYVSDHAAGKDWTGQAEQWHIVHSWLVEDAQHEQVMEFLSSRSLMGRWMPEPPAWHAVYLGELPMLEHDTDDGNTLSHPDYAIGDSEPPATPNGGPVTSEADSGSPTVVDPSNLDDEEIFDLLEQFKGRRTKTALTDEDRLANLHKLAAQWSKPLPVPASPERFARTTDGSPLRAYPAFQEYSWSSSGHDCSMEAPAGLALPCTRLMNGAGLYRDPDNGNWHTSEGQLVVRALRGTRPTGTINTLLVRRDWLTERLEQLQMRIVLGMFGERQPRSSDHLRTWREYSQTALLTLDTGGLAASRLLSKVRRNPGL
ncbi:hypothetical protein ACIQK6_07940 [Streptomyces sp. NPDC091682]|uniref:hypothetical protein n=1 Tax=Streptomyces sp. NPDC091682 TaxID=3366005 RepID=UPI003819F718